MEYLLGDNIHIPVCSHMVNNFKVVQNFIVFSSNGSDKFSSLNSRGQLEWRSFFLP